MIKKKQPQPPGLQHHEHIMYVVYVVYLLYRKVYHHHHQHLPPQLPRPPPATAHFGNLICAHKLAGSQVL